MVSNIFYFNPYLGKIPILTNIFQMGWNHQPDDGQSNRWQHLPPIKGNDPKQNGQPKKTVEGLLEVALRAVSNSTAYVCLASRTDKGVSAKINYGVGDSSQTRAVVRNFISLPVLCLYYIYIDVCINKYIYIHCQFIYIHCQFIYIYIYIIYIYIYILLETWN